MSEKVKYRRNGELREIDEAAIPLGPQVPRDVQRVILRLRPFEPDLYARLRKELGDHEEKQFKKTLKEARKHLKSWICTQCGHENPYPDNELREALRRIGEKSRPRQGPITYKTERPKEKNAVPQLHATTTLWWIDGTAKSVYCQNCLQVHSIRIRLPFPPLTPWTAKNPETFPHFEVKTHGGLRGEGSALSKPSTAPVRLLRLMAKRYRDRGDLESQRRLSIALNELTARGLSLKL